MKISSQDLKDNEENRLSLHTVGQKKAYRLAFFAMLCCCILIVAVCSLAFVPPQFYQSVENSGSEEQSTAGRFVTQIASATNEIQQGNNWGISVRENEINAWLGNDLPRNHPELLGNALWGQTVSPTYQTRTTPISYRNRSFEVGSHNCGVGRH